MAGALGPVLMGRAFDLTGSYASLLSLLSVSTLACAALFLGMPEYPVAETAGQTAKG